MTSILDPLQLGNLKINNRIIMAPLTRMRSKQPGNIPWELNATYYAQRASAGFIITEATQVSQQAQGYPGTPGIHTKEQVQGWKLVTDAVHKKNGHIFLQLWHVGRISHSSHQPNGNLPVAPSAIPAKNSGTYTADWKPTEILTPRALEINEIDLIVKDFENAAKNAKEAGFDGVEVHMANGYLLDQFLQDGSNKRTDEFGGSIQNRIKFPLQVLDAVIKVWENDKVGVRLSPYGKFNDMNDSNPIQLFNYVLDELNKRKILYVHMIEPRATNAGGSDQDVKDGSAPSTSKLFRKKFNGIFISAGGYDIKNAKQVIESKEVDAVAFGRIFISNPDLPKRIELNKELNSYKRETFYGGTEKGYTDYSFLS